MTVKEFVDGYKNLSSDKVKSEKIKSILKRNYCPIIEKRTVIETMLNKSVGTKVNGMLFVDSCLFKINFTMAVLILYTNFEINTAEESAIDIYDLITEVSLLDGIFNALGENECEELLEIQNLVRKDFEFVNTSLYAFAATQMDRFAKVFGMFSGDAITKLLENK